MILPSREVLERHQVWIYVLAVVMGLGLGAAEPSLGAVAEPLLWPVLAVLLFATFTHVPLIHVTDGLRDGPFIGAMLAGNFLLVPLLVAAVMPLLPADPVIRLGVMLVLLVPCTDWSITFTHLAGATPRG